MKHLNRLYSVETVSSLRSNIDFKELQRVLKLLSEKYGLKLEILDSESLQISGTAEQLALIDRILNSFSLDVDLETTELALSGSLDDFLNAYESQTGEDIDQEETELEILQPVQEEEATSEKEYASNDLQQNDSAENNPQSEQQASNSSEANQGDVVLSTMGSFEKPELLSEPISRDERSLIEPVGVLSREIVSTFEPIGFFTYTHTLEESTFSPNIDPISNDDSITVNEDSANNIYEAILLNDIDDEILTIESIDTTGATGTFTLNSVARVLTYEPDPAYDALAAGESATDTFAYTVDDGRGGTATATVTITIAGVNDAPVGGVDTMSVNENATSANVHAAFLANDTDVDTSDTLDILSVDTTGTNGTVTFNGGTDTLTYTADNHEYLSVGVTTTDSFTYAVNDGNGGTTNVSVTVTVTGVNDGPAAQDDDFSVAENGTLAGSVFSDNGNGIDDDVDSSDTITVSAVTGGAVGAAIAGSTGGLFTINADGSFSFDTNGDFVALALGETRDTTIDYTISDGNGGTDTATVTVTVGSLNDAPVAQDDDLTVTESATLAGSIFADNGNGIDDDPDASDVITVTGVTGGAVGAVIAGSAGGLFTINADGSYSFDTNGEYEALAVGETQDTTIGYTIGDGNGGTDTATVTVTVTGVNDGPVAQDDDLTVTESATLAGSVLADNGNGTDSDTDTSDTLTVSAVTGGAVGAAIAGSAGGLFTINADGSYSFDTNSEFEGLAVGETQDTTIGYTLSDGNGGTDTATVTVTVTGVNDGPVAQDDDLTVTESATLAGSVFADNGNGADSDADTSDTMTVSAVTGGAVGAVIAGSAGGLFTINADGSYSFDTNGEYEALAVGETQDTTIGYTISDGNGGTDTATVTVTVTGVNDGPVAQDDDLTVTEDNILGGSVFADNGNGTDSDTDTSDTLTVSAVTGGAVGAAIAGSAGGLFTINADGSYGFNTNSEFEDLAVGETRDTTIGYTLSDGNGGTDTATATMTVTGVNDGPVAQDDDLTVTESATLAGSVFADNGNGTDSDADTSDTITVTGVTGGAVGAVIAGSAGGLFTINADGSYSFDTNGEYEALAVGETQDTTIGYTISDGNGGTDTATVTVTVTGVNDGPVAQDDDLTVDENSTLAGSVFADNGNGTDSDADTSDTMTVTAVTGGAVGAAIAGSAGGLFTINADGSYSFDTNGEFEALGNAATQDTTISYTISDGNGGTDTATVTVTVTGVNDAPVASDYGLYGELEENGDTIVITEADLIGGGSDVEGDTMDITNMVCANGGGFVDNGDDTWTYTSPADSLPFSGQTTITFTLSDGDLTDTATLLLRVFNVPGATAGDDVLTAPDMNTPHYIDGLAGNDTITGSNQRDILIGGAGDDDIKGNDGDDDFIFIGSGNGVDTVDGDGGTDRILGSAGDDVFSVFTFTDIEEIDMGTGTDTLLGTTGDDTIYFGSVTLTDLEQIDGNGGNDEIVGTGLSETLDLSSFTLITGVSINAGAGNDTVQGSQGGDTIIISAGSDILYGNGGDDTFLVGTLSGSITFDGGAGTDTISGTAGDDGLVITSVTDIEAIDLGAGTNYISSINSGTLDLSSLTAGSITNVDYIIDGTQTNTVIGSQGDDEIHIRIDSQADTFNAGDGDDTFVIDGISTQDDVFDGGAGTDSFLGSANDDGLRVGSLANVEFIDLGAGTDYIATGSSDSIDLSAFTAGVDLLNVEYLSDGNGTNSVTGSQGNDEIRITADAYADTINAAGGDDTIVMSGTYTFDENVDGGAGTDSLLGSAGDDLVRFGTFANIEFVDLGAGTDGFRGRNSGTLDLSSFTAGVDFNNVEYIIDGAGTNTVIGTQGDDTLQLRNDGYNDTFNGGDGNDTFTISGVMTNQDNIDGGAGTDTISGSTGDDRLMLSSMANIEVIDLGAGNDYIMARNAGTLDLSSFTNGVDLLNVEYITDHTSANTVTGTQGNDTIVMQADAATDTFNGGDGDDTFSFTGSLVESDNIDGGAGTDQILGSAGDDIMRFGTISNVELIDLGTGTDYFYTTTNGSLDLSAYTAGVDFLNVEYLIDHGSGTNTITGTQGADEIRIQAEGYSDTFNGAGGDDTFVISGTALGNESIDGGAGTDSLIGSAGDDALRLRSFVGIETVDLGAGTDYLMTGNNDSLDLSSFTAGVDFLNVEYITDHNSSTNTITGTQGDDEIRIQAEAYSDTYNGAGGDDTFVISGTAFGDEAIDGGTGTDTILGSAGDDVLRLGSFAGIENIDMGAGTDYLMTGANDSIDFSSLTAGVDFLNVEYIIDHNGSANTLTGTQGDDEIRMQSEVFADTFNGGDGDDTFMFVVNSTSAENIDGGAGTDHIIASVGNTLDLSGYTIGGDLVSIEYYIDNAGGAETITGTNQADEIRIQGDANADTFNGGGGDDSMVFSGVLTGNDIIDGGAGTDTITGSTGNDGLLFASIANVETIDLGTGIDYVSTVADSTLDLTGISLTNVEYITDNVGGAETITGTAQADEIRIQADANADTFNGGDGNDAIVIAGVLTGNDTIDGGVGTDTLTGSAGDDGFLFASMTNIETIDLAGGTDYISMVSGGSLDLSAYTNGVDILNVEYLTDNASGPETLTGSQGDDEIRIQADAFADTFNGGDGDDTFVFSGTATGRTTINGGAGTDLLVMSAGDDSIVLASISGVETVDFGTGTDSVTAASGLTLDLSDYVAGVDLLGLEYITDNTGGAEIVIGTQGADEIRIAADANADTFRGGLGDDTIAISGVLTGNDTIDGEGGTDTLSGSAGDDGFLFASMTNIETIDLAGGTDYISTVAGVALDLSAFTAGVDVLNVEYITDNAGGAETITGTQGNDEIRMQADGNADTFNGGDGDDTITFSGNNFGDTIDGGAGTDTLLGSGGDDALRLVSFTNIETINMGAGTDYIISTVNASLNLSSYTTGVDLLGLEYIVDNMGTEVLTGSQGDDEIRMLADGAADTFNGGDGNDTFVISGVYTGVDTIDGGAGTNTLTGSTGNDTFMFASMTNIQAIDLGTGTDNIMATSGNALDLSGITLTGVEYITDNAGGSETITGTGQADEIRIQADANADTFNGGAGDDTISFSGVMTGNDSVDGGAGTDTITGSGGNDMLVLALLSGVEAINLGAGTDSIVASSGNALDLSSITLTGVEYITDNAGGVETVTGTAAADEIRMQADGNSDTFNGGAGADLFYLGGAKATADTLADFDESEGDVLNIADILSYNSGTDDISDFITLFDGGDGDPANGAGTVTMRIDADGTANGVNFVDYFMFDDQGVNLADMITNGNIVVE